MIHAGSAQIEIAGAVKDLRNTEFSLLGEAVSEVSRPVVGYALLAEMVGAYRISSLMKEGETP